MKYFKTLFLFVLTQLLYAEEGELYKISKYHYNGITWEKEPVKTYTLTWSSEGSSSGSIRINGLDVGDANNNGQNELYVGIDSTLGANISNYRDIKIISFDGENWIDDNLGLTFSDGCDAYCTPNHIVVSDVNMDGEDELYALSSRWLDAFKIQTDGSWNNTNIWFNGSISSSYPQYLKTEDYDNNGFKEIYVGVSTGCYGGYINNYGYLNDDYTGISPGVSGGNPKAFVVYDYNNSGSSQLIVSHNGHGNPNCSSNYGWPTITSYNNSGENGDIYNYPSYNSGSSFSHIIEPRPKQL